MKLVRDRIPERIGPTAVTHVADTDEYQHLLGEKLCEEALKFQQDRTIEELADLMEVIEATARAYGWTMEEVRDAQGRKAHERGRFNHRIVLENP